MNDPITGTTNLYALLIGVDRYLPNQLPGGYCYASLGGCVRDINHVEQFLRRKLGMPQECILKLTATNAGRSQPLEPRDQWPTYENMVDRLKQLTTMAHPGDQVYIHYSGHGGRATTVYPDLKGANGSDEALVPTDIGNSEARYLRDVEMAHLLKTMVDKANRHGRVG
jgi:Caspase domain